MNTPAHIIINLALLDRDPAHKLAVPVFTGAVLPDAPMLVFYFLHKVVWGSPEKQIWTEYYYHSNWQNFIDVFNSIPLLCTGLALAIWRKSKWAAALFLSMLLHVALDLPLHHNDGHRHFYPFSDWRFESPLSYWDPAHYGDFIALAEVALVIVCCVVLLRRYRSIGEAKGPVYHRFPLIHRGEG